ncbi:MAG: hypothetical protein PHT69_02710 [Bacteroidales bacterium]|nr:hypothetical protein [Bacteroidales bacterium]
MCCNLPLPQESIGAETKVPPTFRKHYNEKEELIAVIDEELISSSFKHTNKKIPKAEKQLILKNNTYKKYCKDYSFEDKKTEDDTIFGFLLWLRFNS